MSSASEFSLLQVTARFFPDDGGIETHVYEVARRLPAKGISGRVLTTDRSGRWPKRAAHGGIFIERVRAYPRTKDWFFAPGLWWRIATAKEDIIHFQGVHTLVPVVGMIAAIIHQKPFVLTFHTGGHSDPRRERARSLQWRLLAPLLSRAAALVAVSQHEAQIFQTLVPGTVITVIRNGGGLDAPKRPVEPSPGLLVTSVGRLEKYKGHHKLIEALPFLQQHDPSAHILILGRGPFEQALRARADALGVANHVEITFIDGMSRDVLAQRLLESSCVAMLSDYEAHPVAVMEALTLDLPVVVMRTSGLVELVTADLCRGVDPSASAAEIAASILAEVKRGRRPRLGLPTWESCADELESVYRELLRQRAR